jgi:glycosyltransferase involved in cell wall biosynthesis
MAVRNVIKVLNREKFRPMAVFLCLSDDGPFPDELRNLGTEVEVRRIGRLRNPLNVLRTVRWLARLIKEKHVALVFSSGGHNHPYARMAALKAKCPTICYETFFFKTPFWRNGPIYTLNFLLGTNAYSSYGELASETIRATDPRRCPVFYQRHMVDLSLFDYLRPGDQMRIRMGIPKDAFVYAIVGRIQDWKGQDVFVRAALQMVKESTTTYFVIAGGGWWDKDRRLEAELKRMVAEHGAQERIRFTGFLADPVPVFAASDVICHCSKWPEPTGTVILEAFAMKKPVISVNEGGPLELVRDGIDGWLIPPGEIDSLVGAMKRCLDERDKLAKMGEEGYRNILCQHSESSFSKAINELIERFVSGAAKALAHPKTT